MESNMLKLLKSQNPDKEYPPNIGQKWTDDEDNLLLENLNKNIDIDSIAKAHNRTPGAIQARRKLIAYKLYKNGTSMEEIIQKTKLSEILINQTISNRESWVSKNKAKREIDESFTTESKIYVMHNDINELKDRMKKLEEMMKVVYEWVEMMKKP